MTRKEANLELVQILTYLVEKYPDLRFSQILQNYRFIKAERAAKPELCIGWQNEFYNEPQKVLERVQQALKDMGETEDVT